MVDAYATTLGAATLALNADRFLLEEPHSTAILSLHPALQLINTAHPRPFENVHAFETSDTQTTVHWQSVDGMSASSHLQAEGDYHFRLTVALRNESARAFSLQAFLPLHVAPEAAGACALGRSGLRTLVTPCPDAPPRLVRLQGDNLTSHRFAAWFPSDGRPVIFIGALEADGPPVVCQVLAARGRIVSLRLEAPLPAEGRLQPGETLEAPPLLLTIGDVPLADAVRRWAREAGRLDAMGWLDDFDPSGEVQEVEEPVEAAAESEDPGWFDRALVVHEPPKPEPEPEEPARTYAIGRRPLAGPAFFQRAFRAAEEVWPRWAAGRRYPPLEGPQGRTRQRWRRKPIDREKTSS